MPCISIRQSAPTDGWDPFGSAGGFYTSKQNSDASGMKYQWGHKDPFTFATSSEKWGGNGCFGKYPVNTYTIDVMLIKRSNIQFDPTTGYCKIAINGPKTGLETINGEQVKGFGNAYISAYDKPLKEFTAEEAKTAGIGTKAGLYPDPTANILWSWMIWVRPFGPNQPILDGAQENSWTYSGTSDLDQNGLPLLGTCFAPMPLPDENDWAIPYGQEGSKVIRCDGHNGEYCYYIKGEGKDRVRGNETSIYPEFLKPNTNIGVGNLPLNGVISDNRTYPGKTAGVLSGKRAPELMNMDLGAISARQSAPTDGRDPFGVDPKIGYYTSKQNSDAMGLIYQWGRKDPFTFATSSEQWGSEYGAYGKYPVKIYTIDGVLIYQEYKGGNNTNKQPVGGSIFPSTMATSMMELIKNPITFYGAWNMDVIDRGQNTQDLWDYYWTSYSRGTHGVYNNQNLHNNYLDDYNTQRSKSIYDPCPHGFKMPSNGTYNDFTISLGWLNANYCGGTIFKILNNTMWSAAFGRRIALFAEIARDMGYYQATASSITMSYSVLVNYVRYKYLNYSVPKHYGHSVRCIEAV